MRWNYEHHPLKKLFSGLVEDALCVEVGMCDPKIADYLVTLLLEFLHTDGLYKMCDARGRRIESITAMLTMLNGADGNDRPCAERDMYRHIGDFALFWSGLYPEGLRGRQSGVNPDHLVDYVGRGKESYAIASRMYNEDADPPGSVFRRLSNEFEACVHGLGLVRKGWERRDFEGWDDDPHLLY